jgi:hypothetical protein
MPTKGKSMPPTLKKYQTLQRKKKAHCAGKATKTEVRAAATAYVKAAVSKGQTKTEATKKANKILNGKCSLAAKMAGTRKRKAAPKRKTTARRAPVRARARA